MISVLKALLLSIALGCAGAGTIAAPDGPAVAVGNTVFEVEVADTPQLRTKGLSGRDTLPDMSGMVFVFESGRGQQLLDEGNEVPDRLRLDRRGCTVVDTHSNVQPPIRGPTMAIFPCINPAVQPCTHWK